MRHLQRLWATGGMVAMLTIPALGQTEWDKTKYPDYSPVVKPASELSFPAAGTERPVRVNNAETIHFPPVFAQDGGSCGSASRIAYMFNYEINAWRGLDGSLEENQYPTHFTWLLTNSGSGKDAMAIANGIPNVPTYGGRTYSRLMGNQDCADPDFGWMQGYDKWYAAMFNRLERTANFPLSVETEEGREAVKNWLWNHNGDTGFQAGGVCGIGVASTGIWNYIPATEVNDGLGVTGKYFVQEWGRVVDHAMTIVGYDDRIEFDLDGNGVAGETDKDEIGAWILVNSWGADWNNMGFVYCPYKNAVTTGGSRDYYCPEVYYIRKDYRPLRTFKITMDYSRRSELCLSAGIASDVNATEPERTVTFEHFRYAGDGDGNGSDADTPMLGRWADGVHSEPMEFGYDLTDLSAGFDTRKPLKYFFIIDSKPQATGTGRIRGCSLMDYEFDEDGVELPFDLPAGGEVIECGGGRTVISLVVAGEPLHAPRNLMLGEGGLMWEAPAVSVYALKGYNVYADGRLLKRVENHVNRCEEATAGVRYLVKAVYDCGGRELESAGAEVSAVAYAGMQPATNRARKFTNSGFRIDDLFSGNLTAATIEYWIKPASCTNWNQQMGPGWNRGFLCHTTSSGEFVAGWSTADRITTAPGVLKAGQWTHVAVVVDGGRMTAYINGEPAGEISTSYRGLDGFGGFQVGTAGTASGLNGELDEMRVWSVARTPREIRSLMYAEVAEPALMPGLMLELRMDEEGTSVPVDATGRHAVTLLAGSQTSTSADALLVDPRPLSAGFTLPSQTDCYTGSAVCPVNTSSPSAVRWVWSVDGVDTRYEMETPVFVFDEPGEKEIRLTVYGADGRTDDAVRKITVVAPDAPEAAFSFSSEAVTVGDRVSFINATVPAEGCRYEWSMPGAAVQQATTVNAAARYDEPGEYTVTLTATNAAGSHSVSRRLTVVESAPKAEFEVTPSVLLKGGMVTLHDTSRHHPDSRSWRVSNRSTVLVGEDEAQTFVMSEPGRYDVRLDAANKQGTGTLTRGGAIVVCNADGRTGLNFTGDAAEKVTFRTPVTSQLGFTFDWWMYVKGNRDNSHQIGGAGSNFLMVATADGSLMVTMGNMTYKTDPGFFTPSEWHHYAVVFDFGDIYVYKDCRLTSLFQTPWMGRIPALPAQMQIGGSEGAMNAVIDEFRVWDSALSLADLKAYANQPVDDVAAAEGRHKLVLYYSFNQNGGDVTDATSNANTGVRSGFGPEGDAWSSSLGAFCLSTMEREDVTADYLTNYRMPFLASDATVNPTDPSRFRALLQDSPESAWQVENPTVFRDYITGVYVDSKMDDALTLKTKDEDFEAEVVNHKAYQTVELPAGYYAFGVEGYGALVERESYVVAATGSGLPDTEQLGSALAHATLCDGEVIFAVVRPSQVSVGLLMNMRGENTIAFSRFYLEKLATNDDFAGTGILPVLRGDGLDDDMQLWVNGRQLTIRVPAPRRVTLCSLSGVAVFDAVVEESVVLTLRPGIYVASGHKVVVR
ncbi:MAG: DUF5013 domain-containing protein [Clostridium sp.]|nr:DUF5013 domain-containing protein [Clostridium sp.]